MKASNFGVPDWNWGGATGMETAGWLGGVGLGAVVAQATATKAAHRAARRLSGDRKMCVIPIFLYRFAVFWRKTAIFSPISRVDRGWGLA
jgi:hypothetical protein